MAAFGKPELWKNHRNKQQSVTRSGVNLNYEPKLEAIGYNPPISFKHTFFYVHTDKNMTHHNLELLHNLS